MGRGSGDGGLAAATAAAAHHDGKGLEGGNSGEAAARGWRQGESRPAVRQRLWRGPHLERPSSRCLEASGWRASNLRSCHERLSCSVPYLGRPGASGDARARGARAGGDAPHHEHEHGEPDDGAEDEGHGGPVEQLAADDAAVRELDGAGRRAERSALGMNRPSRRIAAGAAPPGRAAGRGCGRGESAHLLLMQHDGDPCEHELGRHGDDVRAGGGRGAADA